MQGFQPLFAGNAVQHMLAQRVIASEVRVFEVILDGVMHTNGLHDLLRRQVVAGGKGHDFVEGQTIESATQGCPGRFAGITQAPVLASQAPGDFHCRGERRLETDDAQSGKTDERTSVLTLQGPDPEAVLGKMPAYPPDQRGTFQTTQGRGKVAHDLWICTHCRKFRQIIVAPLTQQQARAFELQYRLHQCPPFPWVQVYIAGRILHGFL